MPGIPLSIYQTQFRPNQGFDPGNTLPVVSTQLDSVRSYQFEVRFYGLPQELQPNQPNLSLAAKRVGPIDGSIDKITVERVNDKVFYPGKFTSPEIVVTFDNLYLKNTTPALWEWFKTIADPITGNLTKLSAPGGPGNRTFKANKLTIMELDNTKTPHAYIEAYGVWPLKVAFSEKNYSSSDFSTVEVTFASDFIDYAKYV